jgi:hypothetical protein
MQIDEHNLKSRIFLEGPAGSGKTTYATAHLRRLLESGVAPDRILVLVPQITLGRPYQLAAHESPVVGGLVDVLTIAGIARRAVETYWPLVAEPMGFAEPAHEPTLLNIETAQYFMARIASAVIRAGQFEAVNVSPQRIVSQVLDNLNKAAILRFPLDEVAQRLIAAWGDRHSSRPPVYETTIDLAQQFRAYCLQHNLLDFSLVIEAFNAVLRGDPRFGEHFLDRYGYLIADNTEEDNPAAHDFIRWLVPHLDGALLVHDTDGGYRVFLGADPDSALGLAELCDTRLVFDQPRVASPALVALGHEFNRSLGPALILAPDAQSPQAEEGGTAAGNGHSEPDPLDAFRFEYHDYYPQMIDWTADRIVELVEQGVEPQHIAVLAPYLGDSLRFGLTHRLNAAGIQTLSHRPSRALRDEPVTRALLTLTRLAHTTWSAPPPMTDVADTLSQVIDGLDPVRARLLASIVYRPGSAPLSSFNLINTEMKQRISYLAGERFEGLRAWLEHYTPQAGTVPLDHFLQRLFGELLSQPGYGFHTDLEAGRVAAQLIESARRFRQTLYPGESNDWNEAGLEYLALIDQRLFAALHAQSWRDEDANAVFIAPAFTFLMRNRFVDYQFWLDVGSSSWWERLEQPLTHPYVLRRDYPADLPWTDEMENDAQRELLYRVVMGLSRRCRKCVYLGIAGLGEEGFEQRGPLLRVFQQVLRRHSPGEDGQNTGQQFGKEAT